MSARTEVEWSAPVVVSQEFAVMGVSVMGWIERPGGSVVIVDVSALDVKGRDDAVVVVRTAPETLFVGAGPTTSVDPSVVIVSTPVIEVPECRLSVIVDPSASVSVSMFKPEVEPEAVGTGPTVSVKPSVVMVCKPVMVVVKGNVRTTVDPSGSVSVSTCDVELGDVDTGSNVNVEPPVVTVWSTVVDEPEGKVRVIDDPLKFVRVSTPEDDSLGVVVCELNVAV